MSDTYTPRLPHHRAADLAADAAQEAQEALLAQHGRNYNLYPVNACRCGRTFKTAQGLGLHRGAVERQADKLWDDTYTARMDSFGY